MTHTKKDNHFFFQRFNKNKEEHDVQIYYYHGAEASQVSNPVEKRDFEAEDGKRLVVVRVNGEEYTFDDDDDEQPTSFYTHRKIFEGSIGILF